MEIVSRVFVRRRDRVDAGLELFAERRDQGRARGKRRLPARGVAEACRIEDRVGARDARRPGRVDEAIVAQRMRAAQDPELGEPGEVPELPGHRIDTALLRYPPGVVGRIHDARERPFAALTHCCGKCLTDEPACARRRHAIDS